MPCPRWDSNAIPGLVFAGIPRKHAESGPVRRLYGPVRGGKCGHCPHFFFATFADPIQAISRHGNSVGSARLSAGNCAPDTVICFTFFHVLHGMPFHNAPDCDQLT